MGHTIDDKAAPGKTHSLTDGGGRGTGSSFWLRYFQVEIKLRSKFVLSKALVSAQISDRCRIGWQLVSHTLGCNLSLNVALLRGLPTGLLLWASKKMDVFRSRSVWTGQGRSQMPRLLLGPQRSTPLWSGHLGTLPGVSVTEWILRWALAQSGKELEWEGNRESRVLLFLIPMRLFFSPSFKGHIFLGTHSATFCTHTPLTAGEASSRIVPLWAVTATTVPVSTPGNSVWRTQVNLDHLFKVTFTAWERQSWLQSHFSSMAEWLCSLDPFPCQISICL